MISCSYNWLIMSTFKISKSNVCNYSQRKFQELEIIIIPSLRVAATII
jgi:hypothetical protein